MLSYVNSVNICTCHSMLFGFWLINMFLKGAMTDKICQTRPAQRMLRFHACCTRNSTANADQKLLRYSHDQISAPNIFAAAAVRCRKIGKQKYAYYWNPTRFRQYNNVQREIKGISLKFSFQKRDFGILKVYAFVESNRPHFRFVEFVCLSHDVTGENWRIFVDEEQEQESQFCTHYYQHLYEGTKAVD